MNFEFIKLKVIWLFQFLEFILLSLNCILRNKYERRKRKWEKYFTHRKTKTNRMNDEKMESEEPKAMLARISTHFHDTLFDHINSDYCVPKKNIQLCICMTSFFFSVRKQKEKTSWYTRNRICVTWEWVCELNARRVKDK